jgi:hypothetical protein
LTLVGRFAERQGVVIRALPLLLLLAACASDPELRGVPYRGPDRTQLFVSPHGEPFRPTPTRPLPMRAWFVGADTDRDGFLSAAEFRADGDRWFASLAGADGEIDGFEVSAYELQALPEMAPTPVPTRAETPAAESDVIQLPSREAADGRARRGVNLDGAAPFGITGEPHPVMAADFDQSRRIDRAEFRRASDERFRLLNKTGDGRLSLSELESIKPPRPTPRRGRQGRDAP